MLRRHFTHHSFRSIEFFRIEFYRNFHFHRKDGSCSKFNFLIEIICYWMISHDFHLDSCVDPAFCLNGGTCEVTITGARCHCTIRYQGDRCDRCSERFQGDRCEECTERFRGDDCRECLPGFQGDDCDRCADGYYGDSCSENINFQSVQTIHKRDHSGGITGNN